MKKIVLIVGSACILGYGAYRSFVPGPKTMQCASQQRPIESVIEEALCFELPPTDTFFSEGADRNGKRVFRKITEGNYEAAFRIVFEGLKEFPTNFDAQSLFASLLGDYSEHFSGVLKERMIARSKAIFEKLLCELDGQTKDEVIYCFLNEYNFRLKKYKDQYEHGQRTVARYWNTAKRKHLGVNGYYSQGVGAAHYAKQLFIEGQQRRAREYAQKALVAWAQGQV